MKYAGMLLICPECRGDLQMAEGHFNCLSSSRTFPVEGGIPQLFWPNDWDPHQPDVTKIVKVFYEEHPFPNYDDLDSVWSLREKAEKGVFARLLDEQIPHGARILDVGCGTGQLSNFLGSGPGRTVFGADLCLNSLKFGQAFKERNQIHGVAFLQMNLFRPVFRPASFDVVISNGVLHHASDTALAFQTIATLVKPGGLLIVGLYNAYGRIPTDIRRLLYRVTGNRGQFLDPRLVDKTISRARARTWFADQYQHPHESKHTFEEVLRWFDRCGFTFMNSIPKAQAFEPFTADEQLFTTHPRGSRLDHFLIQLGMLLGGGKEGGLFVMIGRRLAPPDDRGAQRGALSAAVAEAAT